MTEILDFIAKHETFLVKLVGIVIGVLLVVWQVGHQHRSSLLLQKESLRDEQRVRHFDNLVQLIRDAEEALMRVGQWGTFTTNRLRMFVQQSAIPGFQPTPVAARSLEFLDFQAASNRAIVALIVAIEHREVTSPTFLVFRYAITHQAERARDAFTRFNTAALPFLPVDPPNDLVATGVAPRTLRYPNTTDLDTLEGLARNLFTEHLTLGNFLNDLSREAQKRLLGPLFGEHVPDRRPLDPDILVIGSSREQVLQIEERLELAKHLHPDALPSRILFPAKSASVRERASMLLRRLST